MNTDERTAKRIGGLSTALIVGIVAFNYLCLMGCGASQGWRVEFGVAPVTAINNQSSLGKVEEEK